VPGEAMGATPEQRAFELAMGGAIAVMVAAPVAVAVAPAEMVTGAAVSGATGLVVGGVSEIGTGHPADVGVRNTLVSGGVAMVGGPIGQLVGTAGGVRAVAGRAMVALAGAAFAERLKGARGDGSTVAAVTGSAVIAPAVHTVAQLAPRRWRAVAEKALQAALEIRKTFIIRDIEHGASSRER